MEIKDDRKNFTTREGFIFNLPVDYDLDESNGDLFGIIEIPYDIFNDKESVGGTRGQKKRAEKRAEAGTEAGKEVIGLPRMRILMSLIFHESLPRIRGLRGDVLAGLLRTLINGVLGTGPMNQQLVVNAGYTEPNRQAIVNSIQQLLPELQDIGIIINTNHTGLYINFYSQNNNLFPPFHLSVHHNYYEMTRSSTYDRSPIHIL